MDGQSCYRSQLHGREYSNYSCLSWQDDYTSPGPRQPIMSTRHTIYFLGVALLVGGQCDAAEPDDGPPTRRKDPFLGLKAGDEREIGGIKVCWCPAGRFTMGSP